MADLRDRQKTRKKSATAEKSSTEMLKEIFRQVVREEMQSFRQEMVELMDEAISIIDENVKQTLQEQIVKTGSKHTNKAASKSASDILREKYGPVIQPTRASERRPQPKAFDEDDVYDEVEDSEVYQPLPHVHENMVEAMREAGQIKSTLDLIGGNLKAFGLLSGEKKINGNK